MVSAANYGSAAHKASCIELKFNGWIVVDSLPYAKKTVLAKFADGVATYKTVMPNGEIKEGYQVDK